MKNKKRIFAAFAAAAVAVSMFAFAGCEDNDKPDDSGDKKQDTGVNLDDAVIDGDYTEKSDDEVKDIVDNISSDNLFGDLDADDAFLGISINADYEAGMAMKGYMNASGTLNMDYKVYADATDYVAGEGSIGVKANYSAFSYDENGKLAIKSDEYNISANINHDDQFVYGSISGVTDSALKGKIDMNKFMDHMEEIVGEIGGYSLLAVADTEDNTDDIDNPEETTDEVDISIADAIEMAKAFDIAVTFDTSDGVKIKLSASEETIWKALAAAEVEEEMVTMAKEMVTFNKFVYDMYFSIDADGKFVEASEVTDIEVKIDISKLMQMADETESEIVMPEFTAYLKGTVKVTTFDKKITISDTVKAYDDITDELIVIVDNAIENMYPGGGDDVVIGGTVDDGNNTDEKIPNVSGSICVFDDIYVTFDGSDKDIQAALDEVVISLEKKYAGMTIKFNTDGTYQIDDAGDIYNGYFLQDGTTIYIYDTKEDADANNVNTLITVNGSRIEITDYEDEFEIIITFIMK